MNGIDKIIKQLEKIYSKILNHDELTAIICKLFPEYEWQKTKLHKSIFILRNKWYIYDIKKQLYLITKPESNISENELVQIHYWQLLKNHCKLYCNDSRYIWWQKALELWTNNYEIPLEISIVNPIKTSLETNMFDYKISFKKYTNKWSTEIEHFKKLQKLTDKITINNKKYPIAVMELAILEALYSPVPSNEHYIFEIVKKVLKKYKKTLNLENISKVIQIWKHHTSINRLYMLAKTVDLELSQNIYNIIKKYSYVL